MNVKLDWDRAVTDLKVPGETQKNYQRHDYLN